MDGALTAEELGSLPLAEFVKVLGGVYENSPWVAEGTHAAGPFKTLTEIAKAMTAVVASASDELQMNLLTAHPDLAGKAAVAGDLTAESTEEQAKAGLDRLTEAEMETFTRLNTEYREKFGFPFIIAVRNATKRTILGAFGARIANTVAVEKLQCLAQVDKIAWMRLLTGAKPAPTGFLTCHILDTARGCPAAGLRLTLSRIGDGANEMLGEWMTNADGRLPGGPALKGEAFQAGIYEWTFYAGDYFAANCLPIAGQPFLDIVPLRFGIDNPEDHYHVPLLCSPWSFSTYRGS